MGQSSRGQDFQGRAALTGEERLAIVVTNLLTLQLWYNLLPHLDHLSGCETQTHLSDIRITKLTLLDSDRHEVIITTNTGG